LYCCCSLLCIVVVVVVNVVVVVVVVVNVVSLLKGEMVGFGTVEGREVGNGG
jgi:hypothetical protein